MKFLIRLFVLHVFLFVLSPFVFEGVHAQSGQRAFDLIHEMFRETEKVKNLAYVLNKGERIEGKMDYQPSFTKVTYFPMKIYSKSLAPEGGEEILFVAGKNKNRALVRPSGFPWTNLNLDPKGKLMRTNQHHTLLDAGYIKVIPLIKYQFQRFSDQIVGWLHVGPDKIIGEDKCYSVILDHPEYRWEEYVPKVGETLLDIADKSRLSAYLIVERNPELKEIWDNVEGRTILIPTVYAKRMEVYIEQDRKLMRGFKVYDDTGLYEHFEFTELKANVDFKENEFSRDYPDYGF